MNKCSTEGNKSLNNLKHTFKIMRITLFLLFLSILCSQAATGYSQGVELSLDSRSASIKEICKEIEKKSDFRFVFTGNAKTLFKKKVDIGLDSRNIEEILDAMLADTDFSYSIIENQVVIYHDNTKVTAENLKEIIPELTAQQQKKRITGTVTDVNGIPVIGANIVEVGTANGTVTDANGKFSLSVDAEATIHISYIGYLGQRIATAGQSTFSITLSEDTKALDELIVIGYGIVKKSDLTGSISSVKGADLNAFPVAIITQALSGRAAGVQVLQNTGRPGASISLRIRGTNSIMGGNEPLYVIDGFPGGISSLNTEDIESIEILKDASATAIYGSRGANGVVLITTKKGEIGETKVEYEGNYSIQKVRKKLDLLNAKEYAMFYNEQQINDGSGAYFTEEEINSLGEGTDWQDLIFQTAPIQKHSLSVSGGNQKIKYLFGGGHFDQEGIIKNSNYSRNTFKANIDATINNKIKLGFVSHFSQNVNKNNGSEYGGSRGNGLLGGALSAPPTVNPYDNDGNYLRLTTVYPFMSNVIKNPLNFIYENKYETRFTSGVINTYINYEPIKDLTIKISGGISKGFWRTNNYQTTKFVDSKGNASYSSSGDMTLLNENIINYIKNFNDVHNISVMGAFTYENYKYTTLGASGSGFFNDIVETYAIGTASTINVPSSGYSDYTLLSYLGRINYTYRDKYFITANFRADGSSRYSEGDKWGYFPSAALAWRLSNEEFFNENTICNDLKLRIGYGSSGSTAIGAYQTLTMLSPGKVYLGELFTYYAPSAKYPGKLKWETTDQTNFGIDAGFFENKIRLTADYYIKSTRNLLNNVTMPASTGYTYTIQNIGEIQNKGIEFMIDANIYNLEKFRWHTSLTFSLNRNKVIKLYKGEDVTGSSYNVGSINDFINILREGHPVGAFYGYKENGYHEETGQILYLDSEGNNTLKPTSKDKEFIGDPNPDFIYGFNSHMSFNNFEFSFFIQGSQGNDIFNISKNTQNCDYNFGLNVTKDVFESHWKESNSPAENAKVKYPKISRYSLANVSDRFVEDGSYIRLKNIEIAYNVPARLLGNIKLFQIYISAQNALTFTKYSWFDPEVNVFGGSSSINQGIDYNGYPSAKTYSMGVRLMF